MIDFKLLNSALYSFLLGSAFGSSLWGQTGVPFPGRIVQEQPIPSQVIQGQPFQGQIIQGQLIPGQIIQGQPIPGQIIQGPIFQGPITQGPIIQSPITQGPTTTQPASNTKAIAAARAKIAELNKRINALTTENSKLTSVTDLNNQLKNANTKLKEQTDQLHRKVLELEKNAQSMPDDENRNRAQKAKVDQLSALYKTAVQEKDSMTDKVNLLTRENADLKAKIGQNQGNMTDLQANQNSAATQLSKLQQQYQTSQSNNLSLTLTNQELTAANGQLKTDFDTVRLESDDWQKQYLAASQENTTLDGRVTDLSAQNQNYLTSINSLRSEVAAKPVVTDQPVGDVDDSDLEYENSQITDLNSDLVDENKLLNGQVTELQAEIDRLNPVSYTHLTLPTTPYV